MEMENKKWVEKDGVIRFSVTSQGTTGEAWIPRLECQRFFVEDDAKTVLLSKDFHPTNCVITKIAVLRWELFADDDLVTEKIRVEATRRKLKTPNAEVACLFREKFSDKDIEAMGLYRVVTMHKPIKINGYPGLLDVCSSYRYNGSLYAVSGDPHSDMWCRDQGFAFACLP
jgi:hypothetical protein